MSLPFDASTLNGLSQISAMAQEQYYGKALERLFPTGSVSNMLFKGREEGVTGDGETFQAKTGIGDSVRPTGDPYSDFVAGRSFATSNYKVRWNVNDLTAHDFCHLDLCIQIGFYDLKKAADGGNMWSIYNELVSDNIADLTHKMAILRRCGRSAKLADLQGTPKANDSNFLTSAGAASGLTNRIAVDGTTIVWFRNGMLVDVYDSTGVTLKYTKLVVRDVNPADVENSSYVGAAGSIALEYVAGLSGAAGASSISLADNDQIYIAGAKNKGAYSIEAWMSQPSSSTDTLYNRDRLSTAYQWMLAKQVRFGGNPAKISRSHLNQAANVRGFTSDDPEKGVLVVAHSLVTDSLRSQFEEAALTNWDSTDSRAKRYANFGMMGINFQHPRLGLVKIISDDFMKPITVDILEPETWVRLHYGNLRGVTPTGGSMNGWNPIPSGTPGAPLSKHFSQTSVVDFTDVCESPDTQVRINAITA